MSYLDRMTANATPKDPEFSLKGTGTRIKPAQADRRAAQNQAHMEYWRRKNTHRCVQCGQQDSRTLAGRCRCQVCEGYHQMKKVEYRAEHRLNNRCIDCGKKLPKEREGKARCAYCEAACHV